MSSCFFSCCSVFRAIVLYPSPGSYWLYSSPLCFALILFPHYSYFSHSSVCVCIVWVCSNRREFLRLPAIGWQRLTRIGCTLYSARKSKQGRRGEKNSSRLGSEESEAKVRGCFCFEMAGFESRRGTSQLLCQWHTELIGPYSSTVSPPAKAAAVLCSFFSCFVWSCDSLSSLQLLLP